MRVFRHLLLCFLCLCGSVSFAQTIEGLEKEIAKAQKEIENSKKLLKSNKDELSSQLNSLSLIRANIANRKKIIASLEKQERIIRSNISNSNASINRLNKELNTLKSEYSTMVVNNYKDWKQNNFLLFLFSAESVHQLTVRNSYLERIAQFGELKSENIKKAKENLAKKIAEQKKEQVALQRTGDSREKELISLRSDEKSGQGLISSLQSKEKSINSSIAEQTKLISKLQSKIKAVIEAENRRLNEQSEEQKRVTVALSTTFEKNKGKFPSPVEKGVVISTMGVSSGGVKIKSNGVNITTSEPLVYSIFEGVVLKVFILQGLNSSVMVRHGSYISLYSNLGKVYVKEGDKVKIDQKLGRISEVDGVMNLHFELWKEMTPLDPKIWLNI